MSEAATDEQIAEITERLAKATPGPWSSGVAGVESSEPEHYIDGVGAEVAAEIYNSEDAGFICAARNLLPALLSRIAARVADAARIAELEADIETIKREVADGMASATSAWADAARERDTLRADLAAAQAALRPFAEEADKYDPDDDDDHAIWASHQLPLTIGDLRRARALTTKPDGETNE